MEQSSGVNINPILLLYPDSTQFFLKSYLESRCISLQSQMVQVTSAGLEDF